MSGKKILQVGLYSESGTDVEQFVKRVNYFNTQNIGNAVKMDILPYEEGDPVNGIPQPHYKLRFLFPSRQIQEKYWTS
jgi:hypothetical protein